VDARLKAQARQPGSRTFSELRREFIYQRFLARVFTTTDGGASLWVLKGGVGLLARLPGARHSRDIDLVHLIADPDTAVAELREIGRRNMGDHLRFEVRSYKSLSVEAALKLQMDAYVGTSIWEQFDVDVSLERHFVAALEQVTPNPVVEIEGVPALPTFQCYPIVDQVADKVCAMYERHGADHQTPSNRYRDLVDLVLIVTERALDAHDLHRALGARHDNARNPIELPPGMRRPGLGWNDGYRDTARQSSLDVMLHDLAAALDYVGECLSPILGGHVRTGTWSPEQHRWLPPDGDLASGGPAPT
jgi:hypothetical protein